MLVTIGLPFANNERTLPLAIRSIFAQTHSDWELILVEDGSTDGSAELLEGIRDSRVRLIRDTINRGLPTRLNQIARLASGNYLARMDADDVMHPTRIQQQCELLERDPSIDFIATAAYVIDGENRVLRLKGTGAAPHGAAASLDHGCWIHPTAFARTSWFLANMYDESLDRSQDFELWVRVYGHSRFAKIREPLFFYREIGVFNLNNYLATKRADRRIIRRYGPAIVGRARTELMVLETRLKSGLYRVMSLLNAENVLLTLRSATIDNAQRATGEALLRLLDATSVPGW